MTNGIYGDNIYSNTVDQVARKHLGYSGSFTSYLLTGNPYSDEFVSSKKKKTNQKENNKDESKFMKYIKSSEGKNTIAAFGAVTAVALGISKAKKGILKLFKK